MKIEIDLAKLSSSKDSNWTKLVAASKRGDLPELYKTASKLLKREPGHQLLLRLVIYSSKHNKNTWHDVYRLKDLIRFTGRLAEPIDCECVLMLIDIIEAFEGTLKAIRYAAPIIETISDEMPPFYAELLFSTLGVKFQYLGERELADKYHEKALQRSHSGFLASYNKAMSDIWFGRFRAALERYPIRWSWPEFPSIERKFKIPKADLYDTSLRDCKVFVWAEQGIGDQIVWSQVIATLVGEGWTGITLELHQKLVPLFVNSFDQVNVVAQPTMKSEFDSTGDDRFDRFDYHIPLYELYLFVNESYEHYKSAQPFLTVDESMGREFRTKIQAQFPGKFIVGIHWSSSLQDPVRNMTYMDEDCLARLSALNDRVIFVSFHYGMTSQQVSEVREKTGLAVIGIDGVNQKDNLYLATSLMTACDGFIGVYSAPTWQAAFAGVPTLAIRFQENCEKLPEHPQFVTSVKPLMGSIFEKPQFMEFLVTNFDSVIGWFKSIRDIN